MPTPLSLRGAAAQVCTAVAGESGSSSTRPREGLETQPSLLGGRSVLLDGTSLWRFCGSSALSAASGSDSWRFGQLPVPDAAGKPLGLCSVSTGP